MLGSFEFFEFILKYKLTIKLPEKLKPLSKFMKELLIECHERELIKQDPFEVGTTRHSRGLIERCLTDTGYFTNARGKKYLALFITHMGREYLRQLSDEHNDKLNKTELQSRQAIR